MILTNAQLTCVVCILVVLILLFRCSCEFHKVERLIPNENQHLRDIKLEGMKAHEVTSVDLHRKLMYGL